MARQTLNRIEHGRLPHASSEKSEARGEAPGLASSSFAKATPPASNPASLNSGARGVAMVWSSAHWRPPHTSMGTLKQCSGPRPHAAQGTTNHLISVSKTPQQVMSLELLSQKSFAPTKFLAIAQLTNFESGSCATWGENVSHRTVRALQSNVAAKLFYRTPNRVL